MTIPYAAVEFSTTGAAADQAQVESALALLRSEQASDVLVISHGWNNDIIAAQRLYETVKSNLEERIPASSTRRPAMIGVLWPSIRWADPDQIAGGGVSLGEESSALDAAIDDVADDQALAATLHSAAQDLDSPAGRARFVEAARTLLGETDEPVRDDEDGVPSTLRHSDPDELFAAVRDAVAGSDDSSVPVVDTTERAPGVAPDLLAGDEQVSGAGLFGLSWSSLARQVLNTFTYYTMKARAGDVGAKGVAPLIDRIHALPSAPLVHLAGHSFGARVVAAAATSATCPIASLTVLQGAFSHYGFTANYADTGQDGAFRPAVTSGRLRGPLVVTHTHNDAAVRLAYAIASRLARQSGAGLGDRADLYGGIGANGSVGTQATEMAMLDARGSYAFSDGAIHNLLADAHISGHSDVTNSAVVNALAQAMRLY